jgi:hypothetical protein
MAERGSKGIEQFLLCASKLYRQACFAVSECADAVKQHLGTLHRDTTAGFREQKQYAVMTKPWAT